MLPASIETFAIQPPGRETRFAEAPISDFKEYVRQASKEIMSLPPKPLVIFGHSLGAAAAYEVCHALEQHGEHSPVLLIVSGRSYPGCPPKRARIAHLSDDAFLQAMDEYNGTPKEVLASKDLVELFLPLWRADFKMAEDYQSQATLNPTRSPIIAIGSDKDHWLSAESVAEWSKFTQSEFEQASFEGDHFYLNQEAKELTEFIEKRIQSIMAMREAP